ncbi:MAG: hypothetical protein K2X39_02930 [Silvanigrellaceae bacterium]|nr:hypothetical protein [Silvanigrellaceae bacterium]
MVNAKQTYKKGGSQFAGYVRRLEAEGKINSNTFQKIKQPSAHLVRKYGKTEAAVEPIVEPVVEPVAVEYEPQYDDINLKTIKNKKKLTKRISDKDADLISKQNELNKINENKKKMIKKIGKRFK